MPQHLVAPYAAFARVYDAWCWELAHDRWMAYNLALARRHGFRPGSVLDLGCGTGLSTLPLALQGLSVTGVDACPAMLRVARRGAARAGLRIRFVRGDLTDPTLLPGERFALVTANFDVINCLTSTRALRAAFRTVGRLLAPGGLFLFDAVTAYSYRTFLSGDTRIEHLGDGILVLRERYLPRRHLWTGDLRVLVPDGPGRWRVFGERHRQRCHAPGRLRVLLRRAGLTIVGVYTTLSRRPPGAWAERLTFVARRPPAGSAAAPRARAAHARQHLRNGGA